MNHGRTIAIVTIVGSILAGFVSWQALGWPRPLVQSDLVPISDKADEAVAIARSALELARSNNRRILQNDWWRYDRDIEQIEEAIVERPKDWTLKNSLRRLRREQSEIQAEIDKLQ